MNNQKQNKFIFKKHYTSQYDHTSRLKEIHKTEKEINLILQRMRPINIIIKEVTDDLDSEPTNWRKYNDEEKKQIDRKTILDIANNKKYKISYIIKYCNSASYYK